MQNIHTIPAGTTGSLGQVAGSIVGVASYSDSVTLDAQALADAGIAVVEIPDSIDIGPTNTVIGGFITPVSAGLAGPNTFADEAAFEADVTRLPEKFWSGPPGSSFFYDGTDYGSTNPNVPVGEVSGVTITDPGNGYTIGSSIKTVPLSSEYGNSLTINITSVGGNGEITGVSVDDSGASYLTGDTLSVLGGAGNAVLTVGSLVETIVGVLNTGRGKANQAGPNDLNPTYFESTPYGLSEDKLELFIPSSGQVISYTTSLPSPFTFDSLGDCFTGGDFRIQVRQVGDTAVISEIVCPGPQEINSSVDLPQYYT